MCVYVVAYGSCSPNSLMSNSLNPNSLMKKVLWSEGHEFQGIIKNSNGGCSGLELRIQRGKAILKKGTKKRARGVDFLGGIQGHSKRAPIVTTTFQWGTYTGLPQGTKATRKKGTYFFGLNPKRAGLFWLIQVRGGGGGDSAPLGSRPRSAKKLWNLAHT